MYLRLFSLLLIISICVSNTSANIVIGVTTKEITNFEKNADAIIINKDNTFTCQYKGLTPSDDLYIAYRQQFSNNFIVYAEYKRFSTVEYGVIKYAHGSPYVVTLTLNDAESFDNNGEYTCLVIGLDKTLKSEVSIIREKDIPYNELTLISNGKEVTEKTYFHDSGVTKFECRLFSYYKENTIKLYSNGVEDDVVTENTNNSKQFKLTEYVSLKTVEVNDEEDSVVVCELLDKFGEIKERRDTFLQEHAKLTIECTPASLTLNYRSKVNVTCTVEGHTDFSNFNPTLHYKVQKGPNMKIIKSEGNIKINKRKNNEIFYIVYTFVGRSNIFREYTVTVENEGLNVETSFKINEGTGKLKKKARSSSTIISVSFLTICLSLLFSMH